MEKKKKRLFKILLSFLVLILLLHNAFHLTVFGTGIPGFNESGLSGLAIGQINIGDDFKAKYNSVSPASKIILIAEWALIFIIVIYSFARNRKEIKKEISGIKAPKKYRTTKKSTDLDALYNLLKEKKHLRLSTITKVFKIDKDLALSWAKTLESADLVNIGYPKIGEPEVVLNEE